MATTTVNSPAENALTQIINAITAMSFWTNSSKSTLLVSWNITSASFNAASANGSVVTANWNLGTLSAAVQGGISNQVATYGELVGSMSAPVGPGSEFDLPAVGLSTGDNVEITNLAVTMSQTA